MGRAAEKLGSVEFDVEKETQEAKKALAGVTGHEHVELLSSCDAALMLVSRALKGKIMIPDQGGWKSFKALPRLFGLEVREIKTRLGLIDPESLAEEIRKERPKALFLTSFAGYIAEQPLGEIHEVCEEAGVLLVEDASGAIGDGKLGKAENADIIVGSMGAPKVVNLYAGGFVSTDRADILEGGRELIRACKISPITSAGIVEELKAAPEVIHVLIGYADVLKNELETAIHRGRRGVCVGLELDGRPKAIAKRAYERGLRTDQGAPLLTPCPEYNRFLKPGLTIELKKLDVLRIGEEDILKIAEVLKQLAKV
jgi:hypothetical protein